MVACLARSSLVAPVSGSATSDIEPEMSTRSSTRAGLRWSCQSSSSWVSTSGSGTSSSVWGWSGSTPLLSSMGLPIDTSGFPGRNP